MIGLGRFFPEISNNEVFMFSLQSKDVSLNEQDWRRSESCHSFTHPPPPPISQGTQVKLWGVPEVSHPNKGGRGGGGKGGAGGGEEKQMQRKMLSLLSPSSCWSEGSCRKTDDLHFPADGKQGLSGFGGFWRKEGKGGRNRQASSLTRQSWKGRNAGRQKESGEVLTVILFDSSFLSSGVVI